MNSVDNSIKVMIGHLKRMAAVQLILLAGGCASRLPLINTQEEIRIRDAYCQANANDLSVPVLVDVHTHTFNGQFLPLEAIIRQRVPLVGDLAADFAAKLGCVREEDDVAGVRQENHATATPRAREAATPISNDLLGSIQRVPDAATQRMQRANAPASPKGMESDASRTATLGDAELQWLLDLVLQKIAGHDHVHHSKGFTEKKKYSNFVGKLRSPVNNLAGELTNGAFARVGLFVHHTMDMGPSFNATPVDTDACNRFLDFESEQLPRVRELDRAAGGRLIHFVAWNPFRSKHDYDEAVPNSLRIVMDAVQRGARGVKFYPPMGYSAISNHFPVSRWWMSRYQRDSIEKCYSGWRPEDLDALNLKLFRWCAANNIPVFAHCNTGEFRARDGTEEYADPKYWRMLLASHSELHGLRLCLGHAGGEEFWIGREARTREEDVSYKWGREVYELCIRYPNVYCEIGIHDSLASDTTGAVAGSLGANLGRLIDQSGPSERKFGHKILYGSDWYMPVRCSWADYIESYQKLVLAMGDPEFARDFFGGNAIRWLNLRNTLMSSNSSGEPAGGYLSTIVNLVPE